MLGYGNFELANLVQPLLQSDLPAGKEANSGNGVSQGTDPMLKLVSLASDEGSAQSGMTVPRPQRDNPGSTELDKYRQVIADLLVTLSGKITDPALKGNRLRAEGAGTMDLRQDLAKIVQGWMTMTDEGAENAYASRGDVTGGQAKGEVEGTKAPQEGGSIRTNSATTQVIDRLEVLFREIAESTPPSPKVNPVSSESSEIKITRQDLAKIVQAGMTLTDEGAKNGSVAANQKGIQPLLIGLNAGIGTGNPALNTKAATLLAALNSFLRQGAEDSKVPHVISELEMIEIEGGILAPKAKGRLLKEPALLTNVQQKSAGTVHQKGDSLQSTEVSGVKDIKNQISSAGIGGADGKTITLPVWEQISPVIREHLLNRHQGLKELNIQLHPADLGKIQIGMRWENGQVHLVVQASEAATGQLLQNQLLDLRQNLTNQGVNCGMLQMGQGGERQQNPRGDESHRTFNQNTDQNEGEDQSSVSNSLSLGQDGINRINLTA
jgi:flagellar hook-length control protein FliK